MAKPLRVLFVEDQERDVELLVLELRRGGYDLVYERVDTPEAFGSALDRNDWDVILCDYRMPRFSALAALAMVKEKEVDLPFIVVSGTVGEETAVEALHAGAHDFMSKNTLSRLLPAIERELHQAEERREQRRTREALRRTEEKYRGIFENAVVGIYQTTLEGRYLAANPTLARIYGYDSPEELMASVTDLNRQFYVGPGRRDEFFRLVEDRGSAREFESQVYRKDGSVIWITENARAVRDAGGRLVGFEGTTVDITGRKLAEGERERMVAILETTPDFVGIADPEGRAIYLNRGGHRLIGVGEDADMTGFPLVESHPAWARKLVVEEAIPAAVRDGVWTGETALLHRDGREVPVWQTLLAHKGPGGAVMFLSTVARDLSRQRQLEEQFRQAQKMEAVGHLAGGVAHDFNNLLTAITGFSEIVLAGLHQDDPLRRDVEEIRSAGERGAALTRQLLAFSRKQIIAPRVIDLNTVVANMDQLLRRVIGENVEFMTVLAPDLGCVKVDAGQIEQLIMNLAVNGRDAMPNGGKLTIETANADLDEAYAHDHVPVRAGPYVMLAVSDNGDGMDEATKTRIFEPFFTTKGAGKGSGLGLATVYGIVKQHGGTVWVYSEPGQGATFKVYFPRVEEAPDVLVPKKEWPTRRGSETVLVVEDERAVRILVCHVLRAHGYQVFEARQGNEAIEFCRQYEEPISLLVSDVVMPGMSGRQLAERLLASRPDLKVLFLSGYTSNAIVHHGILEEGIAFLQKPFTTDALAQKVRDMLDA